MILVIGGAYQGKLDCAKKRFGLTDGDVFSCTEADGIAFGARCIDRLEEFALWCVKNGRDAVEIMRENHAAWADSVLICEDIFCGVVPLGADMRAWREAAGRLAAYLAAEAETVTRVFCGLEEKLK